MTGFKEILMVNGQPLYDIADDLSSTNEIYPVIFRYVSQGIFESAGNIDKFDKSAREGIILSHNPEKYPTFVSELARTMKIADWRILLDAFKTGDIRECMSVLTQAHTSAMAKDMLSDLIVAMEKDDYDSRQYLKRYIR